METARSSTKPWPHSALRTTTAPPIIGLHPRIPHPGRYHPAGRDLPRGHIGHGASTHSHDDASCSAEVEHRTSSTPACTDGLDLHYSTNNAPTTTRGRSTLRTADNRTTAHDWRTPTNSAPGGVHQPSPHPGRYSALQTTPGVPTMGGGPRKPGSRLGSALRTTPCSPTMGHTHQSLCRDGRRRAAATGSARSRSAGTRVCCRSAGR